MVTGRASSSASRRWSRRRRSVGNCAQMASGGLGVTGGGGWVGTGRFAWFASVAVASVTPCDQRKQGLYGDGNGPWGRRTRRRLGRILAGGSRFADVHRTGSGLGRAWEPSRVAGKSGERESLGRGPSLC